MRWGRTIVLAGCALVAGFAGVVIGYEPRGPEAPSQKLTQEEIFEYQNKQEQPGSADAGRVIFDKVCASCHRFGEIGKEVGPDLTTLVSRFKKRDVLESILWPSKLISDQYKAEMFELNNGNVVSGLIVRENATAVAVRTAENPEKPVIVPKAEIANRAESSASLMPEGLLEGYSQADIANLLTFVLGPAPTK
jgi:putative heme-binding domain-containing protein